MKRLKSLREDVRGVAGFFEEIPVLVIVLVGLFLFLASFVHAYGGYVQSQDAITSREMAGQLADEVRAWDAILQDTSSEGVFSSSKLLANLQTGMDGDFNATMLGHEYQVSLFDASQYADHIFATARSQDPGPEVRNMVTLTSSVVIVTPSGERHAARLLVTIWGW